MPAGRPDPDPTADLLHDPLLRDVPTVEGFKVLDPAVLYARIGEGGMGAVYRGRHFKLDLDVAVKCLKPSLAAEDPDFVKRFEREARLAASIGHQNVVRVMDVQEKNGLHYLVMEFVRGETAAERVRRKGALAEKEALAILLGAAAGLAEAHQLGIVHRDIKPDNIMISLEGRAKLADLGLAKSTGVGDGRSVSMPQSRIMGTPQYMPPEQWDTTDVTTAADVWALGATFYYLLAGRHGISGSGTFYAIAKRIQEQDYPSLRAERPDVRPEVHALLERCVQREPKDRYPDARALLKAIRKLAEDDDEALLDPKTGSGTARAGTVTPPPRQTMLRIRAAVELRATGSPLQPVTHATVVAANETGNASQPPKSSPPIADRIQIDYLGLTMVRIEPATFRMGSPANEEGHRDDETQHTVNISKAYWMAETEVTQKQWHDVMGTRPWQGKDFTTEGADVAATCITWTEAVAFCDKLTGHERAAGRLPEGYRYCLPTEAEWELACRGSATSTTPFCFGAGTSLAQYAVFGQSIWGTSFAEPVRGNRKANAFGLYDMHGNVWEWCADFANWDSKVVTDTYRDGVTDPLCLSGSRRVSRGGCWFNVPAFCRSAFRDCNVPGSASYDMGFRPALSARPPAT